MSAADEIKPYDIRFDVSKREKFHPKANFKRMYRKLQTQDGKEETLARGMLCDMEMGVGKTIMACVLLTLLLEDLPLLLGYVGSYGMISYSCHVGR